MKHLKVVFAIFTVGLIMGVSCKKSNTETDFTTCTEPTYEDEIKPLLESHCNDITCHGADQQPVLTYFAAVKASVDNGSFEKEVISERSMPEGPELTQEEYDVFNCWLSAGAPEKSN